MEFKAEIGQIGVPPRQRVVVKSMNHVLGDISENGLQAGMSRSQNKNEYKLESDGYRFLHSVGRKWPLPAPFHFYGFPDEVRAYYQNADFTSELALGLEQQFDRVYYLGPLRESPGRSYRWTGEVPQDVGFRGEKAIAAMLAGGERKLADGPRKRTKRFQTFLAKQLKGLGLIHSFRAGPVAENSRDYEVLVKVDAAASEVTLKDVGFGVSQVLPVLVQSFYGPPQSTVIMEQPEIHLHPSVQAALADLFSVAIKARENGADRNTQLIVESHSEHFLRRLQTLIAENTLSKDDVALYFCTTRRGVSVLEEVQVDMFGNILNWPENFFGNQMGEIARMQRAQLERRKAGE